MCCAARCSSLIGALSAVVVCRNCVLQDILLALAKGPAPAVPIGLITAAWSGSAIESWMTPDMVQDGTPAALGGNGTCGGTVKPGAGPEAAPPRQQLELHGSMFNGMIAPFLPMRLTGIWWCQSHPSWLPPHFGL